MDKKRFSLRARWRSIKLAIAGFRRLVMVEHNMLIHLVATILVILLGFVFHISMTEAAILSVCIAIVWSMEIMNTAIERIMDHLSPARSKEVKVIKDISAAAVLFSAMGALSAGLFIFLPKLIL